MWTDKLLKSIKPKDKAFFEVQPDSRRGVGRLVVKVMPNARKVFYYRYTVNSKYKFLSIGAYKDTPASDGVTLKEARERFNELAKIYQSGRDVKEVVEGERQRIIIEDRAKRDSATFGDLMTWYFAGLDSEGKSSADRYREDYERNLERPFSELLALPASEVLPHHIRDILAKMVGRGVTRGVNYTRTYLNAAFTAAGKADNNPRVQSPIVFKLQQNPVALVPIQADWDRVGERNLTEDEVRDFWEASVLHMSFRTSRLVRVMLALGGPRPWEMRHLHWDWIDLDERLIEFPARIMKARVSHVWPINDLALGELQFIKVLSNGEGYVFPWVRCNRVLKDVPPSKDLIGRNLRQFVQSEHWGNEGFVPYDVRRTAKTLMGKAGISKEFRDRLQAHALNDVSSKHYDRYDYLTEKRAAVNQWNDFLTATIGK